MKKSNQSITAEQYNVLDSAYKFFNSKLFANQLPEVVLILQRKGKRNLGYFHANRFADRELARAVAAKKKAYPIDQLRDELSLNPDNFMGRNDMDILSTLVHEMAHVWQFRCTEKFPRNGYHDKKWGAEMKRIGLYPSNTGAVGGKETGQQMHHYIIDGGKFQIACKSFLKNKKIKMTSFPIASAAATQNKNKSKYCCPSCGLNIWGKPGANVGCLDCDETMEEV